MDVDVVLFVFSGPTCWKGLETVTGHHEWADSTQILGPKYYSLLQRGRNSQIQVKSPILGLEQAKYKMSLQYLLISENKKWLKKNDASVTKRHRDQFEEVLMDKI